MRKRKKRIKSKDMCGGCYYCNCDPIHGMFRTPYIKKRDFRLRNNLCVACGNNPCKCKINNWCNIK